MNHLMVAFVIVVLLIVIIVVAVLLRQNWNALRNWIRRRFNGTVDNQDDHDVGGATVGGDNVNVGHVPLHQRPFLESEL